MAAQQRLLYVQLWCLLMVTTCSAWTVPRTSAAPTAHPFTPPRAPSPCVRQSPAARRGWRARASAEADTAASAASAAAVLEEEENQDTEGANGADGQPASPQLYSVYLLNDNHNMREFVARALMMVADVSESDASEIMQKASWQGGALVGTWEEPIARHTHEGMTKAGLMASIRPAEEPAREVNMYQEDPFFPGA